LQPAAMILKTDFFAARGQLYLPMLPAQTETQKIKNVPLFPFQIYLFDF
jgi:hypothetical protein